jgi:hypothetical protein
VHVRRHHISGESRFLLLLLLNKIVINDTQINGCCFYHLSIARKTIRGIKSRASHVSVEVEISDA